MDLRDRHAEIEVAAGSRAPAASAPPGVPRRGTNAASTRGATRGATRAVVLSLTLHGVIALALLGTAWGVSGALREEPPPIVLTADFFQPAPASPTPRASTSNAPSATQPNARENANATRSADALDARLRALETGGPRNEALDGLARRFGAESMAAESPASRVGASFAGLVAGNATKVAYVVDASGSMVGSFPAIVDEVERSLARLEPTQQFAVIAFRRDGAIAFGGTPAALHNASKAERAAAIAWLRNEVIPSGRSSPIEALTEALRSGADCVFLLSTTITGPGRHELDRASMLALLDRLNPRDPRNGNRRATIQCIQFLEVDPGGTLEAVAAEHFPANAGSGGFRFISREATSLDAPTAKDPRAAR
ncbi:MAG: hypothetical protein RIR10_1810 [Planctomycetota bacterium]